MLTTEKIVDYIFLFDVALNFRTTYEDVNTTEEVLNDKKIFMHYLKGWFCVDLISSLPFPER
jgi:hypothetical protein